MQVEVKKIIKYCEDYLKVDKFSDGCFNGLQAEGAPGVSKIITGVSFCEKLIEAAVKKQAKMILVHHGLFNHYFTHPIKFSGFTKERLKLLFSNNINLAGFHLPLDAHPVIGNNILLIKKLSLKRTEALVSSKYGEIGFLGEYEKQKKLEDFVSLVNEKLNTKSYLISGGPKQVKKVGIISGGAGDEFVIAKELGADTYLTGEIRESTVRASEESKVNIVAAGHYNTEKLGIQNLGELVAKKFGVKHEFIDIPNDI